MTQPFAQRLLRWYDQHGRKHLPWQNPITPYRVWVSEIMLQQTQVDTVVPYFERFMARFDSVEALAAAPTDQVLHLWTGLGYYARARNLHRCAQTVVEQYNGVFPADVDLLAALPGIGRSTAAAITSIAFEQPTAILDGNVKRVLARHAAIDGWPGQNKVADQLWVIAEQNMPQTRCRDYTQAIMDLGATVCMRARPQCALCPVAADCIALAEDKMTAYPGKKPKKDKPTKSAYLLLLQAPNGDILLQQRPPNGIWGGLWCLPELSTEQEPEPHITTHFGPAHPAEYWPAWRHTFSHYHFQIHPVLAKLHKRPQGIMETDGYIWYNVRKPAAVGLAAPVKTLLEQLLTQSRQSVLPLTHTLNRNAAAMTRIVYCRKYHQDMEGLDIPPFPGPKGEDVFNNISKQAWQDWIAHQTMLINEKHLNMMDKSSRTYLGEQMTKFLSGEEYDQAEGYVPPEK